MRIPVAASLLVGFLAVACGGSTDSGGGAATGGSGGTSGSGGAATGGSGNVAGTGGIDCSNVGCAQPPMCDVGCTAQCGCCSCGDGGEQPAPGGYLLCTGGCWTFVAAKPCGGIAGTSCGADEWCDLPNGCGGPDAQGVCKKRPQGCPEDCPGVCGCDGKQYCNACGANAAGVDTSDDATACQVGKKCSTDSECGKGLKCCYPCGIPGCENQCTVPMPSGQCPMYP